MRPQCWVRLGRVGAVKASAEAEAGWLAGGSARWPPLLRWQRGAAQGSQRSLFPFLDRLPSNASMSCEAALKCRRTQTQRPTPRHLDEATIIATSPSQEKRRREREQVAKRIEKEQRRILRKEEKARRKLEGHSGAPIVSAEDDEPEVS